MNTIQKILLALDILVLAIVVTVSLRYKPDYNLPFKEHIEQLNQEINYLHQLQKKDSVDRVAILSKVDTLESDRTALILAVDNANKRINQIKLQYEKISVHYADASIDSLNKLRSRFGE